MIDFVLTADFTEEEVKYEIRSTKFETNPKFQYQITKSKGQKTGGQVPAFAAINLTGIAVLGIVSLEDGR